MTACHHLFYMSSSTGLPTPEALEAVLSQARRNNAASGLTGMLIYREGTFLQYVEGPDAAVARLRKSLTDDPRHSGIIFLSVGPSPERLFGDWSMGFENAPEGAAAFDLTWRALGQRMPETFPATVRTMMQTVYASTDRYAAG